MKETDIIDRSFLQQLRRAAEGMASGNLNPAWVRAYLTLADCFRISSEMYHSVWEAIGAASMCWKPRPSKEVFASEEASRIAMDLCFKIANELEKPRKNKR